MVLMCMWSRQINSVYLILLYRGWLMDQHRSVIHNCSRIRSKMILGDVYHWIKILFTTLYRTIIRKRWSMSSLLYSNSNQNSFLLALNISLVIFLQQRKSWTKKSIRANTFLKLKIYILTIPNIIKILKLRIKAITNLRYRRLEFKCNNQKEQHLHVLIG